MSRAVRVLALSGSLRKASFNTALLRAAVELAPEGMSITIGETRDLPLYDEDLRAAGLPAPAARLRAEVERADAILVATPEYNYSLPGGLKNAIDWASRPPHQPFAGKALAMMGASGGTSGTMRAQYHLRQVAVFLDMHAVNKPEVFVRNAAAAFDAEGRLVDPASREAIRALLEALAALTDKLRP
jgi:chromate reductase